MRVGADVLDVQENKYAQALTCSSWAVLTTDTGSAGGKTAREGWDQKLF